MAPGASVAPGAAGAAVPTPPLTTTKKEKARRKKKQFEKELKSVTLKKEKKREKQCFLCENAECLELETVIIRNK